MENIFKVGDRVKIIKAVSGSDDRDISKEYKKVIGKITTIVKKDNDESSHPYELDGVEDMWSHKELKLIKKNKQTKSKPIKFLLKYDLDEDPIEEFETLVAVKKRIKEISTNGDLKRDSIIVYKVSKKMPIELVDNIIIKGIR